MFANNVLLRYSIPAFICFIVFENHFTRDTLGALERQIEADLQITPSEYSTLNALYFTPNNFVPLFSGVLCAWLYGPANVVLFGVCVNCLGHFLFALGASTMYRPLLYIGRFVAGSTYELVDCLPIAITGPLFKEEWGLMVGIVNGVLRSGSVLSFVLNPIIYLRWGIHAALWTTAAVSCLGIASALCLIVVLARYEAVLSSEKASSSTSSEGGKVQDTSSGDIEMSTTHLNSSDNGYSNVSLGGVDDAGDDAHGGDGDGDGSEHVSVHLSPILDAAESKSDDNSGKHETSAEKEEEKECAEPFVVYFSVDWIPFDSDAAKERNRAINSWLTETIMWLSKHYPFHEYGVTLYWYLICGVCLYGAMVPFWFIGSKFLQVNYAMSVSIADSYMLLPEGAMVLLAPTFGFYLDYSKLSLRRKLQVLGVSCASLGLSYVCLALGFVAHADANNPTILIPPILSMVGVGVSYGLSNACLWSCMIFVTTREYHLLSFSGLMSCALNILPSIMPLIIVSLTNGYGTEDSGQGAAESSEDVANRSRRGLWALLVAALLAALCAFKTASFSYLVDASSTGGKSSGKTAKDKTAYARLDDFDSESGEGDVVNTLHNEEATSSVQK